MSAPKSESRSSKSYTYELVSLKVGDKVYRVPRHGFTEYSEVFETMLSLPQPKGSSEGLSNDNPIVLPSCTQLEFESLLEILYPIAARLQIASLGTEQWVGVLKLSTLWSMDKIRQLAIDELDNDKTITVTDKVTLAKKYRISPWLVDGYMKIIENWAGKHWTLNELGQWLGWETAARIMELVGKAKEPPKPIQANLKVIVKCPYCRATMTIPDMPNPVKKSIEVTCSECKKSISKLTPSVKGIDYPRPSTLRGEALLMAVKKSFKSELSLCTN